MSYLAYRLSLIRRALAQPAGEIHPFFIPCYQAKARELGARLIAGGGDGCDRPVVTGGCTGDCNQGRNCTCRSPA